MRLTIIEDDGSDLLAHMSCLCPQEHARIGAIKSKAAIRTARLRVLMRRFCLARALDRNPAELRFERSADGRPYLYGNALSFSTSAAGCYAGCVVGPDTVGLDLELRPRLPASDLWAPFLSTREIDALADLSETEAGNLALQIWVRKEALLKALGRGFSQDPKHITLLEGETVWQDFRVQDVPVALPGGCAVALPARASHDIVTSQMPLSAFLGILDAV